MTDLFSAEGKDFEDGLEQNLDVEDERIIFDVVKIVAQLLDRIVQPRPVAVVDLRPAGDTRLKPGITGWAQVNYRYGSGLDDAIEKLRYDLYYIKNYSLVLDIEILLKTILKVFSFGGK